MCGRNSHKSHNSKKALQAHKKSEMGETTILYDTKMGMAGEEQTEALRETDISRHKKNATPCPREAYTIQNEAEIQVKEEIALPRQDMDHKFKESKNKLQDQKTRLETNEHYC